MKLTDERIVELWNSSLKFINGYGQEDIIKFARAIEAELAKEKEPGDGWVLQEVKFDESGIPYSLREPHPCQKCAELESENKKLMAEYLAYQDAEVAAHTALKAENEALRKDAERYRWLRNSDVGPAQIWELLSDDCTPPIMTLKCIHYLDEAIDSAMKGEGKC